MAGRIRWGLVVGAAVAVGGMGAGVSYHKTYPGCLPELPCHDYVWGTISPAVSVFSLDPVVLGPRQPFDPGVPSVGQKAPPGLVVRDRVKMFQLSQTSVALDHCFLSRVALTLSEGGSWTLSLRADQNPWMTGPDREVSAPVLLTGAVSSLRGPGPNLAKQTDGLKRNQFVKVRFYGGYKLADAQPAAAIGKPVLFELPTAMFWVQRGYPYDFWARQPMPAVAQYFDLIDRVEVEFSYR